MRIVALGLLVILSISAVPLINVSLHTETSEASIITLDVCGNQGYGLHAGSDIPFICECLCKPLPVIFSGLHEMLKSPLKSFLSPFQSERPPEA